MALIGLGLFFSRTDPVPIASGLSQTFAVASGSPADPATTTPRPTYTPEIKIYIVGAIRNPGVYKMQPGDRIEDAIKLAGGATEDADLLRIDLAKRVQDEMQIIVPYKVAADPVVSNATQAVPTAAPVIAAQTTTPGKISINTASAAELDKLPGIGEVLSKRIVDYRQANGPFTQLEDLRKVSGISASVFEKIKDLISL